MLMSPKMSNCEFTDFTPGFLSEEEEQMSFSLFMELLENFYTEKTLSKVKLRVFLHKKRSLERKFKNLTKIKPANVSAGKCRRM